MKNILAISGIGLIIIILVVSPFLRVSMEIVRPGLPLN